MGSGTDDPYAEPDEMPLRRVHLDGYWIDQTEVTNAMFAQCVRAGDCTPPPAIFGPFSPHAYFGAAEFDNYPVVNVTQPQAQQYCTWAGRRLPTEAEWEKAARGTEARRYPWEWIGVADPEKLNFCDQGCAFPWNVADVDDGYPETAPVGSYPAGASPYHALDMAGNVWEWTADWYSASYFDDSPLQQSRPARRAAPGASSVADPGSTVCTSAPLSTHARPTASTRPRRRRAATSGSAAPCRPSPSRPQEHRSRQQALMPCSAGSPPALGVGVAVTGMRDQVRAKRCMARACRSAWKMKCPAPPSGGAGPVNSV